MNNLKQNIEQTLRHDEILCNENSIGCTNINREANEEIPFQNIIGYEYQKKEILKILSWFKNSNELKAKGITIPKGLLLYGEPGNGKSLFMREIAKACDCPTFILNGKDINVPAEIHRLFKEARDKKHSVVIIDELDLLISKESRVVRILQECMDGVESNENDILIICATNDIYEIPEALKRHGRLDTWIYISYPTKDDGLLILKKFFNDFNVNLPDNLDEECLSSILSSTSPACTKSIVNDVVLRNGFENITTEMIFDSINRITRQDVVFEKDTHYEVAVHEAGHVVMASMFKKFFNISRVSIYNESGVSMMEDEIEGFWPYEKSLARIKISMGGLIAEKIICGEGSLGCSEDLQYARKLAYNLINISGYSSCWETLPAAGGRVRPETPKKKRHNERKIEKILKKCEKETINIIKENKEKIVKLANLIYEKKFLPKNEIIKCIS